MSAHDVWYLTVETRIAGEPRGFSRQILARPDRTRTIPVPVENVAREFLADVVAMSDLHDYDAVIAGERCDYPYRYASYVLTCNGSVIVRSHAMSPVRPNVMVGAW